MQYRNDHIKVLKCLSEKLPKREVLSVTDIAETAFKSALADDRDRMARNSIRKPIKEGHIEGATRGEYKLTAKGATFMAGVMKNGYKPAANAQIQRSTLKSKGKKKVKAKSKLKGKKAANRAKPKGKKIAKKKKAVKAKSKTKSKGNGKAKVKAKSKGNGKAKTKAKSKSKAPRVANSNTKRRSSALSF